MIDYREIIRLKSAAYSNTSVAPNTGSSHNKVIRWLTSRRKHRKSRLNDQYLMNLPMRI